LDPTEDDIQKLLACRVHLGTKNITREMERYSFARRKDGIHIIDLHLTWQKLMLAARILVAIENPKDICAISARPFGQRAVLKFAQYTGAHCIAGRYGPGTFTNHVQNTYLQPRIIIVADPRTDHMSVNESTFVNLPVIAFCDTDSPIENVDIAIPCNNRGAKAISMLFWMLTREVLRLRGTIGRSTPWEIKVDLFFFRDVEEMRKREEELLQQQQQQQQLQMPAFAPAAVEFPEAADKAMDGGAGGTWGDDTANWDAPTTTQWGSD